MDKTLEECYITLGLSSHATKEEVRKAYKKLALKCHPDKHQNSPEANRKFQELGYAYKRIAQDEELEEINEDCSEFDYWMEVFFYCLLKEHVQVHRNTREHCCPNCAQQDCDEDEEFLDGLYKKHKRKQRETTFTDEEMKHFVKFNSLKEQREFNKKTFCDSKKSSKPKNDPKVQKVKMKTNKQLKAEQWKKEKEISTIAEEIEIKKKQEEQKIEHAKECKEMKKEKEKLECTENGIENEEQVNGNRKQTKEKPKKKHKKERVKTEDNNTQKFERQQPKTCKSTTPAAAKPAATKPAKSSSGIKRNGIPSKLIAPVFRPSKPVQQPAKRPTPITSTQSPNIWMKRLETQNEIREIQPTNEEEELRQLEIALEMSKKQVEIEKQQKQIAALQEEIRLMTLEQEKLQEQSPEKRLSDTCEADSFLDSEVKSDMLTDAENHNERLGDNDILKLNEVSADSQVAKTNEQDKKQLNISCDSGAMDDINRNECDCTCTHEVDSTLDANYAPVLHEPQEQFFRPWKNSKHQTQACASREKSNVEKNKPCPYGRNCCLGKKCKYSHFLAKGGGGVNHNQILCSEAKQHQSHGVVDTKIIDGIEHNKSSTSSQVAMANQCGIMENHLLVHEDWDKEIENNKVLSTASNLLHGLSSSSSVTELSEPWQKGQNSCSVESKGGKKDSNGCEEKEYEKKPVIYLQFDVTNEICATEDWDHEVEDSDVLDPTVTRNSFSHLTIYPTSMTEGPYEEVQGNSFSQTKYPTSMTERPHEEVQEFKAITPDNSMPIDSKTSYTIQPSVPHIIHCGEGSLNCHDGKDKEIRNGNMNGMQALR
ncbi:PH domain-containing protein DDB_G0287875-like isoform X2 [Actinia tenebrosa]|uniref:PH domain-containing protein DDB_G0287875-like isoform X2 n=1 Tax=Actinia tenebrosa TaxID=6105 RepID=A0A6P8IMQ7_ACTTE|nr:PH domain-containing protein DDB_G0287875-like isoform X2 [Actinia tenebrosa]